MTSHDPYAAIASHLHATIVRRQLLKGGVSAHMEALDLRTAGGADLRVVLRQHQAAREDSPRRLAREHALLQALTQAHLPVPAPILYHPGAQPGSPSSLILHFVDGTTEVQPQDLPQALRQMAEFLSCLHNLAPHALDLPALPRYVDPAAALVSYLSVFEGLLPVRAWLGAKPSVPAAVAEVLLHGDFWPGNVLWQGGQLVAVIDWEDAALGDPMLDLAVSRQELLWKHGEAAMETFTGHYLRARGQVLDPARLAWWELLAGARALAWMGGWGLEVAQEARMRAETRAWLVRAAASLGVRGSMGGVHGP